MKTHPILFSTPMVQAILEGRKTMTRRIVKPNPRISSDPLKVGELIKEFSLEEVCDYGTPGDIIWVRETFQERSENAIKMGFEKYYYKAGWEGCTEAGWKPNIFMPKSACRIFLKITDIRVERLQEITENDAKSEGIIQISTNSYKDYFEGIPGYYHPIQSFRSLWMNINGVDSWKSNPWVWVILFEHCEKPENF